MPPPPPPVPEEDLEPVSGPALLAERMCRARDRFRIAAETGLRLRAYEVALELDLSEFHFARQFRLHFGCSPHGYYNQVRAARARRLLSAGMIESDVARYIGFRRPTELRLLLARFPEPYSAPLKLIRGERLRAASGGR